MGLFFFQVPSGNWKNNQDNMHVVPQHDKCTKFKARVCCQFKTHSD